MLLLLHRAFWQLLSLLGIAVSWLWLYTSPLPKPNLRFVRLSTMMLHLFFQSCACSARHVFVFIYFNGMVGEFASLGIGTCGGAAPLDVGGDLLANFTVRWSCCACAAFDSCQQGPNATWTSSIGRSSRKDFVLCSADLQMGFLLLG